MSIDFHIGDNVETINCDDIYGYTKSGSTGFVIGINETSLLIRFDYLSGMENHETTGRRVWEFIVDKRYVKLQDSSVTRKTVIECKIKYMYERQPYYKTLKVVEQSKQKQASSK